MEKEFAIVPYYVLTINGKNVTQDVSAFLSSVEYNDKLEAESDDVQLVIDDVAGLWQSSWYPQQGDSLTLKMGYKGNMIDCGLFEIDEIELSGQPDVMTVKAIAAAVMKAIRTKSSKNYEKQSLRQIAQFVADKHELTIVGDTSKLSKITVEQKTQDNESDLSFLCNLAKEYGFVFSVRGKQLIFIDPEELENKSTIATFRGSQLSTYSFKDKTSETFDGAVVSKRNVKENKVTNWKDVMHSVSAKVDTLIVGGNAENDSQAEAKAKGALREKNKDKLTGSFAIDGNPLLVAGVNVDLQEFGAFSGKWTVTGSRHKIEVGSGYVTDVLLRKGPYQKTVQAAKGNSESKNWAKIMGIS